MERLHRGSCCWTVVFGALVGLVSAGCSSRPTRIRYGSLVMGERGFNYSHNVETFKLANGLVVGLLPDPHANLVSVDVRYRTGAADDPVGKTGLAHLVEHVTFEHRDQPGGPTLNNLLALAALGHNAETTWDATHYYEVALAGKLDELLKIEATRMTRGCTGLDQTALDHERTVVLQEVAQRGSGSLLHAVMGDLYGATHRYAAGLAGTDLATLTLDDVCAALARALADPVMSSTVADELEAAVTTRRALDATATLPAAIAATTLSEVRAVIAADLQPSRMVGLLGGRSPDVDAAYAGAGIAGIRTTGVAARSPAHP